MSPANLNKPRIVKVLKVKEETPTIKSLFFKDELCSKAKPGQFIMVWIPGIDEIPMSVSRANLKNRISSITVKIVGEATKKLHAMDKGDIFGVRGPYGVGFKIFRGNVLVVGGGVGMAPLLLLLQKLKVAGGKPIVIIGARTGKELLFIKEAGRIVGGKNVLAVTEDGSTEIKGLASEVLANLLEKNPYRYKQIYACGPEPMLKKVLELALKHEVPAQLSLERYIKCGIGLCGSCMIDSFRVCRDGPVFSSKILAETREFGVFKREPSGRIIKV